jgi:hypothetical protein
MFARSMPHNRGRERFAAHHGEEDVVGLVAVSNIASGGGNDLVGLVAQHPRQLGYDRAVAAPDRIAAAVLRATLRWPQAAVTGLLPTHVAHQRRRFVALWEDSPGGALGWTDGLHPGLGQLDRQVWLAWLHGGRPLGWVAAWLTEHKVCLDASARPPEMGPSHWLLVDSDHNCAWVGIQGLGRTIVRRQHFHTGADVKL